MKYQNGMVMSEKAHKLGFFQNTRGGQDPKPLGETDYVKNLKERIGGKIKDKTILDH